MTQKRTTIFVGMAVGVIWTIALLWIAVQFLQLPVFTVIPTIVMAFFAPGLVLMLIIGRMAQRRFFDDAIIDGGTPEPGSGAAVDQRVLVNTVEQLVLAICIWPAAVVLLGKEGPGVIIFLGFGFAIARLVFWIGCHRSLFLRAFGFAATFYPTVLVALWALASFGR